MATKVEEARVKASLKWDEYTSEFAKYSEDNLPNEQQEKHLDELRGGATTAQKELANLERFAQREADNDLRGREMALSQNSNKATVLTDPGLIVPSRRRAATIGERFINFADYRQWVEVHAPNGRVPDRATLNSPPLHFNGFSDIDRGGGLLGGSRAELLHGSDPDSGGSLIIPDQYTPITEFGRRPLTIRQVISTLQTGSDSVEFVRIISEDSAAAIVPEATDTDAEASGAVSGLKPESGMTFERVSTPVKTIAHWMPATTRVISDAPQLRGLIDSFLRYYLDLALEDQIVQGNGIGDNFDGIFSTDNVQDQAFDAGDATTGAFFRTARIAKRKVLTIGRRRPTAYLLNPEDWEKIDLAADDVKRFYSAGPFDQMTPRLWGLPVVETEAVPVGRGVVGDLTTCVLWDREQGSISVSNSHLDFFTRNLVAILCELRAAFGILKPNALVIFDTVEGS